MDPIRDTADTLLRQLEDAVAEDALDALRVIHEIHEDVAQLQRDAVRVAAGSASWAEIGEALGVSKQAAHQRFAKEWAQQLKEDVKAEATAIQDAQKRRDFAAADEGQARIKLLVQEFRASRHANRRGVRPRR